MSALKPQDTRALARGAIIAALYTALTVLLAPLSYGEVQIRFSEAFTLLPILMPEAVPALLVGCLLANILGGCTIFDIVFGSLATLHGRALHAPPARKILAGRADARCCLTA